MAETPSVRKPKKKKPGTYHREYDRDVSPLLPSWAPSALNEEASGVSRDEPHADQSLLESPAWRLSLSICGVLTVNLVLFCAGCAIAGALLYFHNFFLTLWWSQFTSGIVLASTMAAHGAYGVVMAIIKRHPSIVAYSFSAACVAASAVSTVTVFMITWNDLTNASSRDLLSGSFISRQWANAVDNGGQRQSDLCSLERELSCRGWQAGCTDVNATFDMDPAMPLPTVGQNDAVHRLVAFIDALGNATQLGNCPTCSVGETNATQTCAVAIAHIIDKSLWLVLGVGFGIVCVIGLSVAWVSRNSTHMRRAQLTSDLLGAQRYL